MFEIIENSEKYYTSTSNQTIKSILLSSEDNKSCILVHKLLTSFFSNKIFVFKAYGMPYEINTLKKYFENTNIYYFEGDSSKIFIKKFPEIFGVVDNDRVLIKLLDDWVSTIYERRYIYVLDIDKQKDFFDLLTTNVFNYKDNYQSDIWSIVDGVVENLPDAEFHNTFIFSAKGSIVDNAYIMLSHTEN